MDAIVWIWLFVAVGIAAIVLNLGRSDQTATNRGRRALKRQFADTEPTPVSRVATQSASLQESIQKQDNASPAPASTWSSGWRFWLLLFVFFWVFKGLFALFQTAQKKPASPPQAAAVAPASEGPPNYATCLLDKLPGSTNEAVTSAVISACWQAHPGTFAVVTKGSGRGLLSFSDPESCILSKAQGTTNQRAAFLMAVACRCLYDSNPFNEGESCAAKQP